MSSSGPSLSIDDKEAWKLLFSALLKTEERDNLDVLVDDQVIKITTDNKGPILSFMELLQNPRLMKSRLGYTLTEVFSIVERKEVTQELPAVDIGTANASQTLTAIFSEDLLESCGLAGNLEKWDDAKTQTLSIPIRPATGFLEKAQAQLKILKSAIIGSGFFGLRDAYLGKGKIDINESEQLASLELDDIDPFVKITSGKDPKFVFEYGKLLALLFPQAPKFDSEINADNQWELTISRKELINYLRGLFVEGFILTPSEEGAVPVCLPEARITKTKNLYTLVLDCSGSMGTVFPLYISYVKSLVEKIVASGNDQDIIRIIDFSEEINCKEFKLSEDIGKINDHLGTLKADKNTNLYGAMHEALNTLSQYPGYAPCIIGFTDGVNNSGNVTEGQLMEALGAQTSTSDHFVPKVFTMALGADCDKSLFTWSTDTGVPVTKLKKIEDFVNVFDHLEKMRRPRLLARLAQGIVQNCFSVYENTLTVAPTELKPEESFIYGQREFVYSHMPRLEAAMANLSLQETPAPTLTPAYEMARLGEKEEKKEEEKEETNRCAIS